jgi:hypothetical protein
MHYTKFLKEETARAYRFDRFRPNPRRWNVQELAHKGWGEDLALAERGITEWIKFLEHEDSLNG